MGMGNRHILDLELDRKLAVLQENILLLKVQAAGLKSHILHSAGPSSTKDMRHMVNNPECSDVTFLCEDGKRVVGSRMLILGRCEVLRSMLSNGMAESEQSEIVLPEISSDVFLLILSFLYTGEVGEDDLKFSDAHAQHHDHGLDRSDSHLKISPFSLDWSFMFKVIKGAEFLLLNQLASMMIMRLWVDLPRQVLYTEEVLNQVTARFTIVCTSLVELNEGTSGRSIYLLGLQLLKIMSEHDLSVTHLRNMSYESMVSYLYHTKNICKDETWSFSFREYVRLWQLITWCIISTTGSSVSYQEASHLCLPDPKSAAALLMNSEDQKRFFRQLPADVAELQQKFAANIYGEHFDSLKEMINLVYVHPELLIHFVEPLGIFSPTELGAVLRNQLLRAARWRKQVQSLGCKCTWQVVDAGKIRLITDDRLGSDKLAVGNAAMWYQSVYEWEIVYTIENPNSSDVSMARTWPSITLEVGFLSLESKGSIEDSCLSQNERGWAFKFCKERKVESIKCMFFENGEKNASSIEGFRWIWLEGALGHVTENDPRSTDRSSDKGGLEWAMHIKMKLDRIKNTCSFSYRPDGRQYSVVCKNLSRGLLFPAVHVLYDTVSCESQTHIKLLEGFELSF